MIHKSLVLMVLWCSLAWGSHCPRAGNAEEPYRIVKMQVQGNQALTTEQIAGVMRSEVYSELQYLLGVKGYSADEIAQDQTRVEDLYKSQGFLDVKANIDQQVMPDLCEMTLVVHVAEGPRYKLAQVAFVGDVPDGQTLEALRSQIHQQSDDVIDWPKMLDDADALVQGYRNNGYPFAHVEAHLERHQQERRADVTFELKKGALAKIAQIDVEGLELSSPRLVMRDFQALVDEPYRQNQLELVRQELLRSRLFNKVSLQTEPVSDDEVRLTVTAKEANFLRLSLTPYIVTGEGLLVSGFISHRNLLGQGVYGAILGQVSPLRRLGELVLIEPRLLDSHVALSMNLHNRELRYLQFWAQSLGAGMRTSVPVAPALQLGFGLELDDVNVEADVAPALLESLVSIPQHQIKSALSLTLAWSKVLEMLPLSPEVSLDLKQTYAGPASFSELDSFETFARLQMAAGLLGFGVSLSLEGGLLFPINEHPLSVSDRYFLGGLYSIRGYSARSIAPSVQLSDASSFLVGGVRKVLGHAEVSRVLAERVDLSGYIFLDAGNSYLEDGSAIANGLVMSAGAGLLLKIQSLPVHLEVSVPFNNVPGSQNFDVFFGLSAAR